MLTQTLAPFATSPLQGHEPYVVTRISPGVSPNASPRRRPVSPFSMPIHEIDPNRIQFQDDVQNAPQGGFALVKRALLHPPISAFQLGGTSEPRPVAVKILKVSDNTDPERLRKVRVFFNFLEGRN